MEEEQQKVIPEKEAGDVEIKDPQPDFKGNLDVAGWSKVDKNGNKYINLKIGQFVRLYPRK